MPNLIYIPNKSKFFDEMEHFAFETVPGIVEGHTKLEYSSEPRHFPCAIVPYLRSVIKNQDGVIDIVFCGCFVFSKFELRRLSYPESSWCKDSTAIKNGKIFVGPYKEIGNHAHIKAHEAVSHSIHSAILYCASQGERVSIHEHNLFCMVSLKVAHDRMDPYVGSVGWVARLAIVTKGEARDILYRFIEERDQRILVEKLDRKGRVLAKANARLEKSLKLEKIRELYSSKLLFDKYDKHVFGVEFS